MPGQFPSKLRSQINWPAVEHVQTLHVRVRVLRSALVLVTV